MKFLKKQLLVFTLFLIIFSANVFSQDHDLSTAYGYLGYILDQQKDISTAMWEYIKTNIHSNSEKKVEKKKDELIQKIKESKRQIQKMPPFEKNTNLRDSMVIFLDASINMLTNEYTEIEEMELQASTSYEFMKLYLLKVDEANKKFEILSDNLSAQLDKFAADNNIELVNNTSEVSANLKIANIVYDYYNEIFLIFFRGYIEDNFIVEAINNKDTNALKQRIDSLNNAYKKGELEIKNIKAYNGDLTVKFACQKSLNHYKNEAAVHLPKILDYYKAEAEHNLAKQKFEAIPQNELTQEDVNAYNFSISKYNNSINVYNQTIQYLNTDMQNNIKQWNDTKDAFLKKHIPK